jgi:hypothetical protein
VAADPFYHVSPQVPRLTMFMLVEEKQQYCAAEPSTGDLLHAEQLGDWFLFQVPLSLFK